MILQKKYIFLQLLYDWNFLLNSLSFLNLAFRYNTHHRSNPKRRTQTW